MAEKRMSCFPRYLTIGVATCSRTRHRFAATI
jgi:hypothetical protein